MCLNFFVIPEYSKTWIPIYIYIVNFLYLIYIYIYIYTVNPHLSGPHLSGLFTYPDTCLGTNHDCIYIEINSLVRIFNYPDSQLGNGDVRINEGPSCMYIWMISHDNSHELLIHVLILIMLKLDNEPRIVSHSVIVLLKVTTVQYLPWGVAMGGG